MTSTLICLTTSSTFTCLKLHRMLNPWEAHWIEGMNACSNILAFLASQIPHVRIRGNAFLTPTFPHQTLEFLFNKELLQSTLIHTIATTSLQTCYKQQFKTQLNEHLTPLAQRTHTMTLFIHFLGCSKLRLYFLKETTCKYNIFKGT